VNELYLDVADLDDVRKATSETRFALFAMSC